jgi:hypothetical protein
MESLALLVFGIFAAQALLGAVTLTFAILNRVKGKFRITSNVLVVALVVQIWGCSIVPSFIYIPLFFLVPAVLVRFLKARD